MHGLSHAQLKSYNEALTMLYDACDLNGMPGRFFEVMSAILPGNLIHISLTKPGVGAVDAYLDQPAHEHLVKLAQNAEHLASMPGVSDGSFYLAAERGPVSFHDLMTKDTLQSTVLWEFFCKPLDLEYDLSINFHRTPDLFCTLSTSRSGLPYTQEDRLLLALLQPHLRQRFRLMVSAEPDHPIAKGAVEGSMLQSHWIVCSDQGRVLSFGPGAQEVLMQVNFRPSGELPPMWKDWLGQQLAPPSPDQPYQPLIQHSTDASLVVHCLRNIQSGQHRLVFQLHPRRIPRLTPRETEIAHWIAEGKSNPEIGTILGISRSTVKIHVERILEKLGVENRTAAAMALRRRVS